MGVTPPRNPGFPQPALFAPSGSEQISGAVPPGHVNQDGGAPGTKKRTGNAIRWSTKMVEVLCLYLFMIFYDDELALVGLSLTILYRPGKTLSLGAERTTKILLRIDVQNQSSMP